MRRNSSERLLKGIEEIGINTSRKQEEQLIDYICLLKKWNLVYNLTGVRTLEDMVSRHLLDTLAIIPFIKKGRWLDVGSGAGIPGIPMAILLPESCIVCLDSNSKKIRFLTQVKIELDLKSLEIEHIRVERYSPELLFDGIISRAFGNIKHFITSTEKLGSRDAVWLAMKGLQPTEEITHLPSNFYIEKEYALSIPGSERERHLEVIRSTYYKEINKS